MIKNLKAELIFLALTILVVFVLGKAEYKITNTFFSFLNSTADVNFKQFFTNITLAGDSFWVFSTSILVCFFCFFF